MGGLSGGGKGGGEAVETSGSYSPWGPQIPHLKKVFGEAERLYDDSTLGRFHNLGPSSITNSLGALGRARANSGQSDLLSSAGASINQQLGGAAIPGLHGSSGSGLDYLSQASQGNYLNSNPHLENVVGRSLGDIDEGFQDKALPGIASQLGVAGASGGSAHANLLAKATGEYLDSRGDTSAALRYADYGRERGLQSQAAQSHVAAIQNAQRNAGMIDSLNQARSDRDLRLADAQDQLDNHGRDYALQEWSYNQQAPWQKLGQYNSLIQGDYGGSYHQLEGPPDSKGGWSGALGGAAQGASIGTSILPGWGTVIGAGLGGILGYQ